MTRRAESSQENIDGQEGARCWWPAKWRSVGQEHPVNKREQRIKSRRGQSGKNGADEPGERGMARRPRSGRGGAGQPVRQQVASVVRSCQERG